MSEIRKRIEQAIKKKGRNADFARYFNVSPQHISQELKKKSDNVNIDLLLAVHRYSGATLDWLLKGEGFLDENLNRQHSLVKLDEAIEEARRERDRLRDDMKGRGIDPDDDDDEG